jgi:hypothetical protein
MDSGKLRCAADRQWIAEMSLGLEAETSLWGLSHTLYTPFKLLTV